MSVSDEPEFDDGYDLMYAEAVYLSHVCYHVSVVIDFESWYHDWDCECY